MADDKEDGEKLFSENVVVESNPTEGAKFIPESTKKKVAPISIEGAKAKFTGLTKEELMKYAKDPFWIRLRWFLFILFWLVWFLMLFAAVFVIIITPKCKEPEPPKWWQRNVVYMVDIKQLPVENFRGNDSVIGALRDHIDYLSEINVESVWLSNVLEGDNEDETMNYTDVNPLLVSVDMFKKDILKFAESKGISITISIIPNHSAKNGVFIRSEIKEENYKDMYVWYPKEYASKPVDPPNNWLSVYNQSAWEWNEKRKQFYLHQFNINQPDFNFTNPSTVEYFNRIFRFWLDLGVRGIFLKKCEYLIEDPKFEDEENNKNTSFTLKDYGFYYHVRTFELPQTVQVIANWSREIQNRSGMTAVTGGIKENKNLVNMVLRPVYFSPNFTAKEFHDKLVSWSTQVVNPAWQWRCSTNVTLCFPEESLDALAIVSFLLPGTPVLELGQELGYAKVFNENGTLNRTKFKEARELQSADAESHLSIIKKLIKLRGSPGCLFGNLNITIVGESVFAFTRVKSGHPGYLIAWNVSHNSTVVNLSLATVPDELVVVIRSGGVFKDEYTVKSRVQSTEVKLPAFGCIVFSYVPKK